MNTQQDTSFHDCKHKHMMKSGTPQIRSPVPYRLPLEFHGFISRINSKGYHVWFLVLSQFF